MLHDNVHPMWPAVSEKKCWKVLDHRPIQSLALSVSVECFHLPQKTTRGFQSEMSRLWQYSGSRCFVFAHDLKFQLSSAILYYRQWSLCSHMMNLPDQNDEECQE